MVHRQAQQGLDGLQPQRLAAHLLRVFVLGFVKAVGDGLRQMMLVLALPPRYQTRPLDQPDTPAPAFHPLQMLSRTPSQRGQAKVLRRAQQR